MDLSSSALLPVAGVTGGPAAVPPPARFRPLRKRPKYAAFGVTRPVSPEQTVRRVRPLVSRAGVTRIADVTGLDRVGIPNYTSVRPREAGAGISYYNGKGVTRADAHAGALMEAVERYSGERCDLAVVDATFAEILRHGPAVDPRDLWVPLVRPYDARMPLEWVLGVDLLSERPTYVPLNAVVCPYLPRRPERELYIASTNGLAAGNAWEDALCQALCEVVERDAVAMGDAARDLRPAIAELVAGLGLELGGGSHDRGRLIRLGSLPTRARRLVYRLERAGLTVYLRDLTSTAGIATVTCNVVERHLDGRCSVHGGSGTHPDARVAVTRALTEAAQSRVGHIQGGREDLPEIVSPPAEVDVEAVFGAGEVVPFSALPSVELPDVDADVRLILDRLAGDGFPSVVAVDLTRPELGIPVVRVVIPGAETWSVYYTHIRRARFGARVGSVLSGAGVTGA